MINKDFFKKIRILDGGMGQELLARGMKPNSTLWSANAILDENYHQLVLDTHIDFIKAGAEIIVTTTFATRQKRLKENNLLDKFEYLNQKAGEIAQAAKQKFFNTYIAGGIPPQNLTYEADDRNEIEIIENFHSQAKTLNPYVDFFYFDVWSSIKEVKCGIEAVKEFKKSHKAHRDAVNKMHESHRRRSQEFKESPLSSPGNQPLSQLSQMDGTIRSGSKTRHNLAQTDTKIHSTHVH